MTLDKIRPWQGGPLSGFFYNIKTKQLTNMAKIISRVLVKTGWFKDGQGTVKSQFQEIGTVVEFENQNGGVFERLMVNANCLEPTLAAAMRKAATTDPSRQAQNGCTNRLELILKGSAAEGNRNQGGKAQAAPPPQTKPAAQGQVAYVEDEMPF